MFHSIPLQRAQVVRVAQLGPQLFEDGPVPLLPLAADLALEVSLEIGGDVIVVDERVVHVDQEYDRMRGTHRGPASGVITATSVFVPPTSPTSSMRRLSLPLPSSTGLGYT